MDSRRAAPRGHWIVVVATGVLESDIDLEAWKEVEAWKLEEKKA